MASVFLSYGRDDGAQAKPIAAALERAGHSVWWDRHIGGGSQFSKEIEQALNGADVVLVLWSPASVDSAWVRDEAGAGRDRGQLVPLSLKGTQPPLGFRQFQAINLGTWGGRGKVPRLNEILAAIERQTKEPGIPAPRNAQPRHGPSLNMWALIGLGVGLFFVVIGLLIGHTWNQGSSSQPTVAVSAADASPRSQSAAAGLLVKLGELTNVGAGKWQLTESVDKEARPDLLFRVADTGSDDKPQSSLVLLDGKSNALLWSREFTFPAGQQPDLRQQLSLTAGRVLGCVLESRKAKGVSRDQLKLFLEACASLADEDLENYDQVAAQLRSIVAQTPSFKPAWGRLLFADSAIADVARNTGDEASKLKQLKTDLVEAKSQFPDLPEIAIGAVHDLKYGDFGSRIQILQNA
ncbi:MAG: TIR domain-containing protein, partial [Sphingomonas sp.]|nr:TIR domain-containing protein [Sphingomonas sp.]